MSGGIQDGGICIPLVIIPSTYSHCFPLLSVIDFSPALPWTKLHKVFQNS